MLPWKRELPSSLERDTLEADFRNWRYDVPGDRDTRPLGPVKSDFWKQALTFVGYDVGLMQETIVLLSSNGGLRRIQQLVDRNFSKLDEAQFHRLFDEHILPFFELLSHKNVTTSVILVTRVTTIYNILYNNGEVRPVRLFDAVARHLRTLCLHHASGDIPNEEAIKAMETSLAVFFKLIEVNTSAQIHEGLKNVAKSFELLFEGGMQEAVTYALKPAKKHLRQVEQRLGLGIALPNVKKTVQCSGPKAAFQLDRDPPGELSEDGPRHDNDKVNIGEISILPTLQEIKSSRIEYLPPADPLQWHLGGIEGLLDRQFRLLREDTVGQLREAAKFELENLQNPQEPAKTKPGKLQGARTFVYQNVKISDAAFDPNTGMDFALRFDQPEAVERKGNAQRRQWWENSKRLGCEALICLLSSAGHVIFLERSPEPLRPRKDAATDVTVPLHKKYDLWSNKHKAYVIAKPVNEDSIESLLRVFHRESGMPLSLVEFPGILLPAFKPTLEALQQMSDSLDVPFANILAPVSTPANPDREINLPPPEYTTAPGFRFDLSSITTDDHRLYLAPDANPRAISEELSTYSSLDPGQAEALVSSLLRCMALIQGPPGTGKSYTSVKIVQVLLRVTKDARLGPIIYVSFTNHALDQGLERLLDEGVDQIIRVGSFSKSERLEDVNLRAVSQNLDLTKTEKNDRWLLKKSMNEEANEIVHIMHEMSLLDDQRKLKEFLRGYYPNHHDELFLGQDMDGFEVVNHHGDSVIERWLSSGSKCNLSIRSIEELEDEDLFSMSNRERKSLHRFWIEMMSRQLQEKLRIALGSYHGIKKKLDDIKAELDLRVLRKAQVIGLTTSGLARKLHLLRRIDSKILICEEAGEVLESSFLTALLPTIQHAILIGDHQQLRPHVQNYDLSIESLRGRQYALDVSLFERLAQPQDLISQPLPLSILNVQRRMHPSISQLVREMQYPELQDGTSLNYPEVIGMRRRLFWMNHSHGETGDDEVNSSHTNDYEVNMVAALVRHLVRQGTYQGNDIAVITPYLGQLRKIRNKLAANYEIVLSEGDNDQLLKEGDDFPTEALTRFQERRTTVARDTLLKVLRIATVDNFQGEEAKVVIVSLVRSNMRQNAGFLRTQNRINVLLSRAQHGMYVLGDANTIGSVQMWNQVIRILRNAGNFGDDLELCCPRHKDSPIFVRSPDDFVRFSPEGGCSLSCDKQLPCGHACTSKCHSELMHNAIHCLKPCTRPRPGCTHNCPLPCGNLCPKKCLEIVSGLNITLPCGHQKTFLPCFQYQNRSEILCDVIVTKTVSGCGHKVEEKCHVDVNQVTYLCAVECNLHLDCGHQCRHPCCVCRTYDDHRNMILKHPDCKIECGRNYLTCKHRCKSKCHGKQPCPLCNEKCEVRCSHAACDKSCNEPCTPCAEPHCNSYCPHSQCGMPCAAPCDWLPCSMRCSKMLTCGCRCPGLCGEKCPKSIYCQTHGSDDIRDMQADLILFESYGSINPDEDPCIFTACGHIFTLNTMDGIMDMKKYYAMDPISKKCIALLTNAEPFSSAELKTCPECRGPLRDIARYGRITRRALLDESAKKLTSWSNFTIQNFTKLLSQHENDLISSMKQAKKGPQPITFDGNIKEQLIQIKKLKNARRYGSILALRNEIDRFGEKIFTSEQPYQRVRDLVETRRRSQQNQAIPEFHVPQSELQLREHLQAASLLTRTDIVILSDVLRIHRNTARAGPIMVNLESNRNRCEEMVESAHATHNIRQETEGHIFWATFAAIEYAAMCLRENYNREDKLHASALMHLDRAHDMCNMFRNDENVNPTKGLAEEANEVRKMLEEGISRTEMRMIVAVMNREFVSTGHWYRCENGHPFTVGECGLPMELSRCPDCGANVGGQSHRPAEGVQEARDISERFGGLNIDD
ncbi:hypothetical protein M433DRAFT_509938 [Acidomyces richmondensis BFW]|nr:hypothetical protein M433DRAFT_509938 [Acidomyces richmondensis BFW]